MSKHAVAQGMRWDCAGIVWAEFACHGTSLPPHDHVFHTKSVTNYLQTTRKITKHCNGAGPGIMVGLSRITGSGYMGLTWDCDKVH